MITPRHRNSDSFFLFFFIVIELKNRILQRVNSVCSDKDEKNQGKEMGNGKELTRKNSTIENMTTK